MSGRREDHHEEVRRQAQRSLDELGRRWPVQPNLYVLAVVIVALITLLLTL